jgi:DNA-binding beta-propeller fold protein YncE
MLRPAAAVVLLLAVGAGAHAASSGPVQLGPDGSSVWVVNPDTGTVTWIDPVSATPTGEVQVGRYPRTLAVTAQAVYVANQGDDSITQLAPDGSIIRTCGMDCGIGFGCAPYGVVAAAGGDELYVSCEGTSRLLVLGADLALRRGVTLGWPEARALAVGPDGLVYVTHYVTKEPNNDGHVSVVDPSTGTITGVLAIKPDVTTCETLGSGQGVANLLSAIAVLPGTPPQLWVGGTLHNSFRKGLFERSEYFKGKPGIGLFPDLTFAANPGEGVPAHRNIYKPALHDIARSAIWKIDLGSGDPVVRLDLVGGATVNGIDFSPARDTAYAVDLIANAFYVFSTGRGAPGNAATLFGPVSAFGTGGADPTKPCTGDAQALAAEDPYILVPQARLVTTGGMDPLDDAAHLPVETGVEWTLATDRMRGVPDGVGTTPIGVVLSADGHEAYVANYLARNVAIVHATAEGFGCLGAPATACSTRLGCPGGADCMPLVRAVVRSTARHPLSDDDVLPAEILDGKILFTTSARDARADVPIPSFNHLVRDVSLEGEVTSTARDGASLSCTSCHADFGGNDGRTWDFAQFGSSLRNTMDLRGRASFAPGRCDSPAGLTCTTDAECKAGGPGARCLANPDFTPAYIADDKKADFLNPMGSTHWNGDRDEVEDFEFTFRGLLGASDCDGNEFSVEKCFGGLVMRSFIAGFDPQHDDVQRDLSPEPNRHRGPRLDHVADYVYSLTEFVRNPNLGSDGASPSPAAARGRLLFNDPVVQCGFCHNSTLGPMQQFTDKKPNSAFDPKQIPKADDNSPFLRHDVGTTNLFDTANPFSIASDSGGLLGFTLFQDKQNNIPGTRKTLNEYITPVMNDIWSTPPFLHDGSAPTLLDVVRPCTSRFDQCNNQAGLGRNVDRQHGDTRFLSARQLNDLVAFEKAPHGPIGEVHAVTGAVLDSGLKLQVRFGRQTGRDSLTLAGAASVAQQTINPSHAPVVVSVGTPAGEEMAVVERTIPATLLKANKAGTSLRFSDARGKRVAGVRQLLLKLKHGRLNVRLVAAGLDLSPLRVAVPDYTLGVEIGELSVAVTRRFKTSRKGTVVKGP